MDVSEILLLVAAGFAGGVFAGMGMGGGTLLIPLLTLVCRVPQHTAQSINLVAFIPTALIALIIHFKKGLVDYKSVLPMLPAAVAVGILASLLARNLPADILKKLFGGFIAVLGVIQLIGIIGKSPKSPKSPKTPNASSGDNSKTFDKVRRFY